VRRGRVERRREPLAPLGEERPRGRVVLGGEKGEQGLLQGRPLDHLALGHLDDPQTGQARAQVVGQTVVAGPLGGVHPRVASGQEGFFQVARHLAPELGQLLQVLQGRQPVDPGVELAGQNVLLLLV